MLSNGWGPWGFSNVYKLPTFHVLDLSTIHSSDFIVHSSNGCRCMQLMEPRSFHGSAFHPSLHPSTKKHYHNDCLDSQLPRHAQPACAFDPSIQKSQTPLFDHRTLFAILLFFYLTKWDNLFKTISSIQLSIFSIDTSPTLEIQLRLTS